MATDNQNKTSNKPNLGDAVSKTVDDRKKESKAQESAELKWRKEREKALKELGLKQAEINKTLDRETLQRQKANQKELEKLRKEGLEEDVKTADKFGKRLSASVKLAMSNAGEFLTKAANSAYTAAQNSVKTYTDILTKYQSDIEARIQGSGKTFQEMYGMIRRNVGSSQYVAQTKVLENLGTLVSQGIAYNVEQRAFLQSIKEDIATTFDVADSTLLRLIRIQQADSTAARLGMEAFLTDFLNRTFQDTSYLNNAFDTTAATLLDLSASYNEKQATEFEFITQKWLGSLASVGVSDATLSALATGINALGSGEIDWLQSSEAMARLFVMASGRTGVGVGQQFTQGFTSPEGIQNLLLNVIEYAQSLADTNNRVLLNQYAKLFGVSVADLYALKKLDVRTLEVISKTNTNYAGMLQEVEDQLGMLPKRLHLAERIDNVIENTLAVIGGGIANNAAMYTTYVINDLVEAMTGGINIPSVFGFDLNANVNQLVKIALLGTSLMSSIPTVLTGLFGKTPELSGWGAQATTARGTAITTRGGAFETVSQSMYVGNGSYEDIKKQTIAAAEEEAGHIAGEGPTTEENIKIIADKMQSGVDLSRDTLGNIASILTAILSKVSGISAEASVRDISSTAVPLSTDGTTTNTTQEESEDSSLKELKKVSGLLERVLYEGVNRMESIFPNGTPDNVKYAYQL